MVFRCGSCRRGVYDAPLKGAGASEKSDKGLMEGGESADARATEVDVFGLFSGGAFHELPFQRPGICGVRRVYDNDRTMLSVARELLGVADEGNVANTSIFERRASKK